jgi:hypothetical protein
VHLPREVSWLGAYVSELLAFPAGRHDDQVDSTSIALHYLTARTPVQRERRATEKHPASEGPPASVAILASPPPRRHYRHLDARALRFFNPGTSGSQESA